jgi:hypothetical protein
MNKSLFLALTVAVSASSISAQSSWVESVKNFVRPSMDSAIEFSRNNPRGAAALATAAIVGSVVAAKLKNPAQRFVRTHWKGLGALTVGAVAGIAAYKNLDAKTVGNAVSAVQTAMATAAQEVGNFVSTSARELWSKYVTKK